VRRVGDVERADLRVGGLGHHAQRRHRPLGQRGADGERVREVAEEALALGLVRQRRGDVLELVALGAQLVVGGRELLLLVLELGGLDLELGLLAVELVVALLQRVAHRVERAGELGDLVLAADRHARGEVSARQAVGGGRDPADRDRDPAADIGGEGEEERHDGREHDDADGHRAHGGAIGRRSAPVGAALLGGVETGELRVDAELAGGLGRPPAARADGVHERDGELVDVAADPGRHLLDQRLLCGVVPHERAEPLDLPREGGPGAAPRSEEAGVARQRVAARAGLEVEQLLLGAVGRRDHLRRVPSVAGGVAHVADRHQQRADREPDDQGQRRRQQHHARGQVPADVHSSASGPRTSRTFSRSWMGENGLVM
jgi:hypothetical protein